MNPPTLTELIACATREAGMRRRVYPNSDLSPKVKERELRGMDGIVTMLWHIADSPECRAILTAKGAIAQEIETPSLFQ